MAASNRSNRLSTQTTSTSTPAIKRRGPVARYSMLQSAVVYACRTEGGLHYGTAYAELVRYLNRGNTGGLQTHFHRMSQYADMWRSEWPVPILPAGWSLNPTETLDEWAAANPIAVQTAEAAYNWRWANYPPNPPNKRKNGVLVTPTQYATTLAPFAPMIDQTSFGTLPASSTPVITATSPSIATTIAATTAAAPTSRDPVAAALSESSSLAVNPALVSTLPPNAILPPLVSAGSLNPTIGIASSVIMPAGPVRTNGFKAINHQPGFRRLSDSPPVAAHASLQRLVLTVNGLRPSIDSRSSTQPREAVDEELLEAAFGYGDVRSTVLDIPIITRHIVQMADQITDRVGSRLPEHPVPNDVPRAVKLAFCTQDTQWLKVAWAMWVLRHSRRTDYC